jgi:hypothetical protein
MRSFFFSKNVCVPLKLHKQTTYFDYCIVASRAVAKQRPGNRQLYKHFRSYGLVLSIWSN